MQKFSKINPLYTQVYITYALIQSICTYVHAGGRCDHYCISSEENSVSVSFIRYRVEHKQMYWI